MFLVEKIVMDTMYKCGNLDIEFAGTIPYIVSTIVTLVKIVVPVLLIIFGMIDLGKAVVAAKEDEIKKGQQTFIKRAIAAMIVFFVVQLVQMLISFTSNKDANVVNCFNCFVNGKVSDKGCISQDKSINEE